jgi:general secretion pathway protein G
MRDRFRRCQKAFTLIELMVVILIIGLLATIVVQNLRSATDKAKHVKAQADVAQIKSGLDRYYLDNGSYPSTDQGLNALCSVPQAGNVPKDWSGPYLEKIPPDPWGNAYYYPSDGNSYVLKSFGADGAEGGEGKNQDIDGSAGS